MASLDTKVAPPLPAAARPVASAARDAILELKARIGKSVLGQDHLVESMVIGLLANGNLLIESLPGLAKTRAVKTLAKNLAADLSRVQFTPDLLPSDVTGAFVYDQKDSEFVFRPGPIFTGLLLADEINRTPPKTQAALLESMQEHQVTVEGQTFPLPTPFHVLATANPVEYEGTYPLPEAQLDRFMLRLGVGYPEREDEWQVLARRMEREVDEIELQPVVDGSTLLAMQGSLEQVHVSEQVGLYMVDLVTATRVSPRVWRSSVTT